ncbi:putative TIM-barrel fold metal-dependent hydrolase [Archangium gephyra]|uniref:TIM-barrel fold metal-dependent hydrolase n=2 Tax=Archangium gephyra TaxID=48 RepID=A0ABX9K3U1_9BACT|nr:amidohydrolase family protein [Archangium gephyra]REG32720.1 putative TIM-barrel fold metal-dependent hydrolase [Archangium gephyra]
MHHGFRILDADRHVMEPIGMWKEYLDPAFRDGAPYLQHDHPDESLEARVARLGPKGLVPLPPVVMLDGQPVLHKLSERAQVEMAWNAYHQPAGNPEAGTTPHGQLQSMDQSGVDLAFLYPSFALMLLALESLPAERVDGFARAYNSWLRDFCRVNPERLRGVGAISLHDPERMVPELERVAGFGWTTVTLWPTPVRGRLLSDPAYEPFWSACERLDISVGLHGGTHSRLKTTGADRFDSRFGLHACSHPMEQMMALLALIEGGVLERHPGLRVAFLESGCGWLLYWLWRLDELVFQHMAGEVAGNVRLKPSEYFRRQCFVAIEPDEPYLPEVIRLLGEDNLLFGTDFPHVDHDADIVSRAVALQSRLPEQVLRKILWDNPARFHGVRG